MRPIPAPRIGESHGLLRAISQRERIRLDEFVTEFSVEDLFPPGLENAFGRTRQFVSFARAAGLVKEDRGTVELTEIGKRYVRAGDEADVFAVSGAQADWLRRQLLEKHMTDSIYHGLAIGLSLLSSVPPATRISILDFGRALGYLGRAGWDNDNTLQIQGERYLDLLRDVELIDEERGLTRTGHETKAELTLPIHMSLGDLAAQLNPGGAEAVRAEGEAEWGRAEAALAPEVASDPPVAGRRGRGGRVAGRRPGRRRPAARAGLARRAAATAARADRSAGGSRPRRRPPRRRPRRPRPPTCGRPPSPTRRRARTRRSSRRSPPRHRARARTRAARGPRLHLRRSAGRGSARPQDAATVISQHTETPPPAPGSAAAAAPPPVAAPPPEPPRLAEAPPPPPRSASGFLDVAAIRSAAESQGLRLPGAVYANVAAALAAGKHVVLIGAAGSGKTTLALAIAQAAASSGPLVRRDARHGRRRLDAGRHARRGRLAARPRRRSRRARQVDGDRRARPRAARPRARRALLVPLRAPGDAAGRGGGQARRRTGGSWPRRRRRSTPPPRCGAGSRTSSCRLLRTPTSRRRSTPPPAATRQRRARRAGCSCCASCAPSARACSRTPPPTRRSATRSSRPTSGRWRGRPTTRTSKASCTGSTTASRSACGSCSAGL